MAALRAYPPKAGSKVQVIGAGLPRTATNSFCAACTTLLDGPAYHVGVQSVLSGDLQDIIPWMEVMKLRPYKSPEDKKRALDLIAKRLDGYVATADPPLSQLIPELMELYPDAKVVCTTRDRNTWATSMEMTVKMVKPRLQRFIFYWLGNQFDYLPVFWETITQVFEDTYGKTIGTKADANVVYDRHHAWLKEIVPKDKLLFFSVKDGWEPLCKALNVPVPDQPFPRLNDAKSFEDGFKAFAIKGLLRWAMFFGLCAVLIGVAMTTWKRSV